MNAEEPQALTEQQAKQIEELKTQVNERLALVKENLRLKEIAEASGIKLLAKIEVWKIVDHYEAVIRRKGDPKNDIRGKAETISQAIEEVLSQCLDLYDQRSED